VRKGLPQVQGLLGHGLHPRPAGAAAGARAFAGLHAGY
jgi:hypothetical protein